MPETKADRVLGIVPARAGSKGIPGKNTKLLAGKPLLHYSVAVGRECPMIDRLVLSTESPDIARLGRELGIEVPFMRPPELAQDDTAMVPVLQHAVTKLMEEGWSPDVIVLLQPTAPLRRPEHVQTALAMLSELGCDSVVSVVQVPEHYSPGYVMKIAEGRLESFLPTGESITRRQDAPPAYSRDGSVYAFRVSVLLEKNSVMGDDCRPLVIPQEQSVNLDSPADWKLAEEWISRNNGRWSR